MRGARHTGQWGGVCVLEQLDHYLDWSAKLTSIVNNNAIFQWKSYGDHIQNYPLVLKITSGRLTLLNRQPDNKVSYPWAKTIHVNTWTHITLGIHTSEGLTSGWGELYLNGVIQKFSNGLTRWPCRTWDSRNDPNGVGTVPAARRSRTM